MERKLTIQAPRETVAVNIMAGGDKAPDTLHWCLKSVLSIADEIIVVDCGLNEEARRILDQYPVTIVPGLDPLVHGFEAPRNIALENSVMDWILWLDTDERLVGAEFMTKYLRPSVYDGFSIYQHHFGIGFDAHPDMPVRLFRHLPTIRFYGMIHEHPETGVNKGPGMVVILSDVNIIHIGYESEKVRQARFLRNQPMLQKDQEKYPDRLLQKHFIMRDNIILANSRLARSGMDEEVKRLAEETIELWRKYFKGGNVLINIDSIQYYSRACEILGLGVEVAFDIQAGRDGYGAKLNGGGHRFATKDDLMSEISWRAERSVEPYLHKDF